MNIRFRSRNLFEKTLDILLVPVMYLISGTFKEKPQQTHKWNIRRLTPEQARSLDENLSVKSSGSKCFIKKHWLILFHFPIFGGWKQYVTLQPEKPEEGWHIGWGDEISSIALYQPVRMLKGPGGAIFFALSRSGQQIQLKEIGEGMIGDGSHLSQYPLL